MSTCKFLISLIIIGAASSLMGQKLKEEQVKLPKENYYLNVRDIFGISPAISLGVIFPINNRWAGDSQIGILNPFTSISSIPKFIDPGYDILTRNNYGIKFVQEFKHFTKNNQYRLKWYHGFQMAYQFERTEGEVEYLRYNLFNQLIHTEWIYHTTSLYAKAGLLSFQKRLGIFHDFSLGFGIQLVTDINSALRDYPATEISNNDFDPIFPINTFKPNSFYVDVLDQGNPGNTSRWNLSILVGYKVGLYKTKKKKK